MDQRVSIILILVIAAGTSFIFIIDNGSKVVVRDENITPFSGLKAYSHIENLVELGPRSIGSDAISLAREYISEHLCGLDLEVMRDGFSANFEGRTYEMENIIAVIPGITDEIIAIGGHYDTKEIPGANDGGSSSGLLLELARVLAQRTFNHTIWIIFFDGEDTGKTSETMFYGSRHLAGNLKMSDEKPRWLIVPDMIGDRRLMIRKDRNSDQRLVEFVWMKAEEIGYGRHFSNSKIIVLDDHVPFMAIGVSSCVLIDFKYGPLNSYWHTCRDDLDKIDQNSLKALGDVICKVVEGLDSGELAG